MHDGLHEFRIAGLLSFRDVTFRPGRLTVLIGPNGSGKSNLLKAFELVARMRTGNLRTFVAKAGGASWLLHGGPKKTEVMKFTLSFSQRGASNSYEVRLGYAASDQMIFLEESVTYATPDKPDPRCESIGVGHSESKLNEKRSESITARTVSYLLSGVTFFHFHDTSSESRLRGNGRREDDRFLRSDGSNLAAFLLRLQDSEAEAERKAFDRIGKFVRRVAPMVRELAPTPLAENAGAVRLDWIDDQGQRFGVAQLSDGTLRAIALITALAQPTSLLPQVMTIDEPELGLHPAAISVVASLARSISRHTQVIFATQSTTFLDHFKPEEVVVVEREGGESVLRTHDTEGLEKWLEDYTLAEIFEKGVLGGRP